MCAGELKQLIYLKIELQGPRSSTLIVRRQYEMLPYMTSAHPSICWLLAKRQQTRYLMDEQKSYKEASHTHPLGADPFLYHPARLGTHHSLARVSSFEKASL